MRSRLLIAVVALMTLSGWYIAYRLLRFTNIIAGELEHASELTGIAPRAQTTMVMDRHGRPAFAFYTEQRMDVPIDRVSSHMISAIIAVEDRRFFAHYGLDPIRIAGAALHNLSAGRILEGGSTITQQLARAAQLSPTRTFERKLREAMISLRMEERYSKTRILQEYLNTVYFGEGFYGVEAASHGYFAKPAAELEPAEAALLAGLVRSPSLDSPCASAARAIRRRNLVLRLMREQDRISDAQLDAALAAPLPAVAHERAAPTTTADGVGDYFQEEVRRELVAMFGSDRVLRGGLRVYSTFDPVLQRAADQAVRTRIAEIAQRRRGAANLQGSLVAIDPGSGEVLALVGGRSFAESPFNRATQARRQAGSAFKPIIFAAALERGYAPGSILRDLDQPMDAAGGAWMPGGEHEEGEVTLRKALALSSNRAAAQLLQEVGVGTAVDYAHRLGIGSNLPAVPSLALGTGEVTLLELTASYGVFANRGLLVEPHFITRVEDADGTRIWTTPVTSSRAISSTTAFLMSSMLADVVTSGTATSARAAGFRLPAGGKTGTTDDYADAWFVGYTPHLVTGVWFGFDMPTPIMNRGFASVVAVPAWARFMKAATNGARPEWFEVPPDVEKVAICRISGARATDGCWRAVTRQPEPVVPLWPASHDLLPRPVAALPAPPEEPPVFEDYFPIGTVPPDLCPLHGGISTEAVESPAFRPASSR